MKKIMHFLCALIAGLFFLFVSMAVLHVITIQFYVPLSAYLIAYDIIVVLYVLIPQFLGVEGGLWRAIEKRGYLYHICFCIVFLAFSIFISDQHYDVSFCITQSKNTQECIETQSEILLAP